MFQSTRPGWAATSAILDSVGKRDCFNPRGPGGPRQFRRTYDTVNGVSIHAARVGRDDKSANALEAVSGFNPRGPGGPRHPVYRDTRKLLKFQSTRPGWAATITVPAAFVLVLVSIHAARVGRD